MDSLTVAAPGAEALKPFVDLIADELNVKEVRLTTDVSQSASYDLQLLPAVLGPRVGSDVQQLIKAVRAGDWSRDGSGAVVVAGRRLAEDEYNLRLVAADETTSRALPGNEGLVVLDTSTNPALEAEGMARDVIRLVQMGRKEAGLHISDRIRLWLELPPEVGDAVQVNLERVTDQTLAVELVLGTPPDGTFVYPADLDGQPVAIGILRAGQPLP